MMTIVKDKNDHNRRINNKIRIRIRIRIRIIIIRIIRLIIRRIIRRRRRRRRREEEDTKAYESPLYRFLAIAVEWDEDGELRRVRIVPR